MNINEIAKKYSWSKPFQTFLSNKATDEDSTAVKLCIFLPCHTKFVQSNNTRHSVPHNHLIHHYVIHLCQWINPLGEHFMCSVRSVQVKISLDDVRTRKNYQ